MGLLADPWESWNQGFNSSLNKPKLLEISKEIAKWCENYDFHIKDLAVHFAINKNK